MGLIDIEENFKAIKKMSKVSQERKKELLKTLLRLIELLLSTNSLHECREENKRARVLDKEICFYLKSIDIETIC